MACQIQVVHTIFGLCCIPPVFWLLLHVIIFAVVGAVVAVGTGVCVRVGAGVAVRDGSGVCVGVGVRVGSGGCVEAGFICIESRTHGQRAFSTTS